MSPLWRMAEPRPTVGLFVTCLVDTMRPAVGFAAVKLLQNAGCDVVVPAAQTCCGQPAMNSGDRSDAKALARRVIDAFERVDYVVAPSGSCAGTIKTHYPELFDDEPEMAGAVARLAERTWELTSFLTTVMKVDQLDGHYDGVITYHELVLGAAGIGHQGAAAGAAGRHRRPVGEGNANLGNVLRLWRHVLRQISRDLRQDG